MCRPGAGAVSGCRRVPRGHRGMSLGTRPQAVSAHGGSVWDAMPMTFVRFMFFLRVFFDGNGWEMKMWIHPQK